jgi:chromosome segregation ATPase
MDFGSIIRRGKKLDKAFEALQTDMAHALEESMVDLDEVPFPGEDVDDRSAAADEPVAAAKSEPPPEENAPEGEDVADGDKSGRHLTPHSQNRLVALKSFERFYNSAQGHLHDISSKLAEVRTLHSSVGELINILHGEIHRANEMELANTTLLVEHRKLWEQFQDSTRKHQERESLLERLQQRETMLFQDNEALRASLATAKLELVEVSNANVRNEAEVSDLTKTLGVRTGEIERRSRENETLREKNVNLSIELDKMVKREAETRHKLEETVKIHENEAARNSELLGVLARNEKDALRIQKALDNALAKQSEMQESIAFLESERETERQRNTGENRGLRAEIQALQSRLENLSQDNTVATGEIAELKEQLSEAVAEKQVLEERLSALIRESEADRMNLAHANASLSELTLRQASEQIQLDVRVQECEDLRAEIAGLHAQIKELLPYERLHRVTQARQREAQGSVVDFPSPTADTKRSGRRPNGSGRRQAV